MENFKDFARNEGWFASGNDEKGYRIAVKNPTQYINVSVMVESFSGYNVSEYPKSYPHLVKITKQ